MYHAASSKSLVFFLSAVMCKFFQVKFQWESSILLEAIIRNSFINEQEKQL